jgi:hypothetical protein
MQECGQSALKQYRRRFIKYGKKEKLRHACQAENQWEDVEDVLEDRNTSDYKLPELLPP